MENVGILFIAYFIGTIIGIFIREFKPKNIYKFRIENEELQLFLINIFGKTKTVSLSVNTLISIKHRGKGFWRRNEKIYIHLKERTEEYCFFTENLGKILIDKLNVDKI